MSRNIKFALIAVLIAMFGLGAYYYRYQRTHLDLSEVTKLPNSKFERLNGTDYIMKSEGNKGTILAFIITDCNYCNNEMKLYKQYYSDISKKFNVYFISVEEKDVLKEYFKDFKNEYPLYTPLLDSYYELDHIYKVQLFPTIFIYDENGNLKFNGISDVKDEVIPLLNK